MKRPPSRPNGIVLAFRLLLRNVKSNQLSTHSRQNCIAFKAVAENGNKMTVENLEPGSYSLKVSTKSLASDESLSNSEVFTVVKSAYSNNWLSVLFVIFFFVYLRSPRFAVVGLGNNFSQMQFTQLSSEFMKLTINMKLREKI